MTTEKTCLVISHDEDFLNTFTDSVLYLDVKYKVKVIQQQSYAYGRLHMNCLFVWIYVQVFSKNVEHYNGDYWVEPSRAIQSHKKPYKVHHMTHAIIFLYV